MSFFDTISGIFDQEESLERQYGNIVRKEVRKTKA
jgi:hypothetical protein